MTANENVKTETKLRTRLLTGLRLVMEQDLPLDDAADAVLMALDCDPGHDATADVLNPGDDRSLAVYTYRSIIRSALADRPDGGSAF